jgi:Zn finger protein HypA/HybF (possibly regulating hydrogenase expression)
MHEYNLTKQIVHIVNDAIDKHNAKCADSAELVIGENTSIIPDCVQLYFDQIAKGTKAEGTVLHVQVVKSEMYCANCHKNFVRPMLSFECPICHNQGSPTEIGNEFYVKSVALEIND